LGDVTGNNNIGGFVGVTWRSDPAWREPKIDNSSASGNVTGIDSGSPSYIIGGFGGSLQNTIISRCYAEGTVTGGGDSSQFVGGFAANFVNSTVSVSYAAGDVTGASLVGGFAGRLIHTAVSNCYARGNVTGSGSSIYYVGGFVGILESAGSGTDTSLIKYCYATGTVTAGSNNVGGFAGTVKDQSVNPIQFSFFRDGNNAGGDVFANPESSVNLMDITTFLNAPKNPVESGIIESWNISVAPGSTSQPLLVMFSMSTSSAFGTPTIWYLIEGEDYPKFFWEWAKIEVTVTANSAVYDFDGTAKSVGGFSVDWANGNPEGAVLSGLSVPTVSRTAPGTTPVVFAGTPVITIGGTDVTAYYNITIVDGTLVINGSTGGGGGSGTGNATVVPPGNGTPPEPPTPPTPPTPPEPPTPPGNGPGGISWIWYAVLVAVAIIGLFFLILFYRRRNEEEEELEKI
jgi:hypothetical protein